MTEISETSLQSLLDELITDVVSCTNSRRGFDDATCRGYMEITLREYITVEEDDE